MISLTWNLILIGPASFYKLSYLDDEVTSPAIFILQKYKKKSSFQVKLFTEFKMLIKLFNESMFYKTCDNYY